MEALEILKRAALEKCRECRGTGEGNGTTPVRGAQAIFVADCSACNGTGLWLPELSEECPGDYYGDEFHFDHDWYERKKGGCQFCQRTGRISIFNDDYWNCGWVDIQMTDRLDAAAERLGFIHSLAYRNSSNTERVHIYATQGEEQWCQEIKDTRIEARQAALASVIIASGLEVSDG